MTNALEGPGGLLALAGASNVEFYPDLDGHWRWRARAANGRIVADSGEGYHSRRDAELGARNALEALSNWDEQKRRENPIDQVLINLFR